MTAVIGPVSGVIDAAQLTICEGAKVEGRAIAQDTVVQGEFKGTIHGNTVKLQASAVVKPLAHDRAERAVRSCLAPAHRPVESPSLDRTARQPMSHEEATVHLDMALKDIVA